MIVMCTPYRVETHDGSILRTRSGANTKFTIAANRRPAVLVLAGQMSRGQYQ